MKMENIPKASVMYTMKKLLCLKKDTSRVSLDNAKHTILEASKFWVDFDPKLSITECPTCNHFLGQSKGGRPTKSKLSGPQKRKPKLKTFFLIFLLTYQVLTDAAATSTPRKRSRPAVTSVNVVHKGSSPHF
ncbi:hypothetical protein BaRGS_00008170 [Batillaria attramentaria]|uniref:Transposase n=1 Tax=Batillaria attramentaria TaxID=370345 RepID=A0ABD0LMR5_9CAEN